MMKFVALACLVAVAAAMPQNPSDVVINVKESNQKHTQVGTAGEAVTGSYSYTDDEGREYTVNYIADDKGYRVTGSSYSFGSPAAKPVVPAPRTTPAPPPPTTPRPTTRPTTPAPPPPTTAAPEPEGKLYYGFLPIVFQSAPLERGDAAKLVKFSGIQFDQLPQFFGKGLPLLAIPHAA